MSSEKRLIALNIFESEVPPLKSSLPSNALFEKSCFSTQQTQKSFSMIASATFMRSAVSEKRSARARASMMATLFTRSSPQAALPRHKSIHTKARVLQETSLLLWRETAPQCINLPRSNISFPKVSKGLNHERRFTLQACHRFRPGMLKKNAPPANLHFLIWAICQINDLRGHLR